MQAAMPRQQTTPEQHSVRLLKVGERVRHVLSEILTRQQVHDDTLSAHSVSVTEVRMSPDLRLATAFVKPMLGANEDQVLTALRQNTAYFQKEVARNLGLKSAAKLRFRVDATFDEADRIDRLLSDPRVKRDLEADSEDSASD
jgi:ribosome-binding factor A